jgi:hypothetical protein
MTRDPPDLRHMVVGKWLWSSDYETLWPLGFIDLKKNGLCEFWNDPEQNRENNELT